MNDVINPLDDRFNRVMAADWIRELESSDSRIHKEKVVEKALMAAQLGSTDAQCFLFNCYQAYNPYYAFHIKQVPETVGMVDKDNPWVKFWALLEDLRTRGISGRKAREAIEDISEEFDSTEWNGLARRVLIKDLRCGISEKTINKVVGKSAYKIPVFSCQLATDSTDRPAKMTGIKRLECKLDGVRVLAVVDGNDVNLYSRNGKQFDNFVEIQESLRRLRKFLLAKIPTGFGRKFVLDGEVVGESFQKLMKQAHRKSDAVTTGMVYHIFDIISLDEFQKGFCNLQQERRINMLEDLRSTIEQDACLHVMTGLNVDLDTAEGHDIMNRYAQDAVKNGFEGIMIKDLAAPYECKRSSFWMKWKPTITVDLNIIGFEEGTGRNLGRVGAIICEGDDNERHICVNVGSGLSDSDRDEYWAARHNLVGRVVEVEADAVTQNQDGSYSLRFPRFLRFRGFEPGEKM